jgi:hypothetical protein
MQQVTYKPGEVAEFDLYDFQSIFGTGQDDYGRIFDNEQNFYDNIGFEKGGLVESDLDDLIKILEG